MIPLLPRVERHAKMKLGDLNYELLQKIVQLYDRVVGGHGSSYFDQKYFESILETFIKSRRAIEWRFGSKITPHSKLWISYVDFSIANPAESLIYFWFNPNIIPDLGEDPELAKQLESAFDGAISELLEQEGVLVPNLNGPPTH